jgi:hypothetical protein
MRFLLLNALLFSTAGLAQGEAAPASADAGFVEASADAGLASVALDTRVAELEKRLGEAEARRANDLGVLEQGLSWLKQVPTVISAAGVKVSLTGFAQADAQWRQASEEQLDNATRDPLNQTQFLIRRARFRPQIEYGVVSGALEADFNTVNGAQARLVGAEVSAHYTPEGASAPLVMATLGQFKIPFGLEVQQSDRERLFMERSNVIRSLFPGEYDLGLRVQGQWRFLRYAVSWMNGHPIGERAFALKAPTAPRDVVGRLGVDAQLVPQVRVEAGFSALVGTGFHPGTPATKDQIVWRDVNGDNIAQASELQIIPGQPAIESLTFGHQAIGGDVRVSFELPVLGTTQLVGELVWSKNLDRLLSPADPISTGRDLRALGWHAGLTQQLTKWFAVGVRYDRYNPDLDAADSRSAQILPKDQTFTTLAVTGAFFYRPVLRVLIEYDHNTNALGRDAQGTPTTLNDDAVIARAEVSF